MMGSGSPSLSTDVFGALLGIYMLAAISKGFIFICMNAVFTVFRNLSLDPYRCHAIKYISSWQFQKWVWIGIERVISSNLGCNRLCNWKTKLWKWMSIIDSIKSNTKYKWWWQLVRPSVQGILINVTLVFLLPSIVNVGQWMIRVMTSLTSKGYNFRV